MKNLWVHFLLILGLISSASCASSKPEPKLQESEGNGNAIVCQVFYRTTRGGQLQEAPQIRFDQFSHEETREFEDMQINAQYLADQFEGNAFRISITNKLDGKEITNQLYQLDKEKGLSNQFIGGHGFTGLVYVYHPDSSSEIQFFCITD